MDTKGLGASSISTDSDGRAGHSVRAVPHDVPACTGLPALPRTWCSTPNAFASRMVQRFTDLTG